MTVIDKTSERLAERLEGVLQRIKTTATRCNRNPKDISLIAISKTHPPELLRMALEAGLKDLGENRVQEAESKIVSLGRHAARWHLVGHLQANKARRAVKLFDLIHSLDSVSLARRLDRMCADEGTEQLKVLIQVDLGGEDTKSGIVETDLRKLVTELRTFERLRLIGFMTLPPFFEDPERTRPFFRKLRDLRNEFAAEGAFGSGRGELSMGMTHDFEVAIEEGATMLRIGTAIFGERSAA